jgi:hypothetical protein
MCLLEVAYVHDLRLRALGLPLRDFGHVVLCCEGLLHGGGFIGISMACWLARSSSYFVKGTWFIFLAS